MAAAVVYVHDLAAMTAFYVELGLVVEQEHDDHYVLVSKEWELVLMATAPARDGEVREQTPIKLAFVVAALPAHDRIWEWRGFRICDITDPEGNVVQLRQPA